jgi:hypothetical protein
MDTKEVIPPGFTFDEYLYYVEAILPKKLCVSFEIPGISITIAPPYDPFGSFMGPCPGLGIGSQYNWEAAPETLWIAGHQYKDVQGAKLYLKSTGVFDFEFYAYNLDNGFAVRWNGGPRGEITYESYLAQRSIALEIIATLHWFRIPDLTKPGTTCAGRFTRLVPGVEAVAIGEPDGLANRIRSGPGTADEVIYQLNPQSVVKTIEGPVCTDGYVFWKIENSDIPVAPAGWRRGMARNIGWSPIRHRRLAVKQIRGITILLLMIALLPACAPRTAEALPSQVPSAMSAETPTKTPSRLPIASPTLEQLSDLSQLGMIAFTGIDEKTWIVNADGTNLREWESALPGGGAVSPDRRFYATGNHCTTIYSIGADGIFSLEKEIVLENDVYCSYHAWSPDGKYLAFLGQYQLYIVSLEGWDVQKISYVPDDQAVYSFRWAPDGERIALYRGLGEGAFSNEDMFKNTGIDIVTINGAQETMITGILSAPVIFWSQDGSQLIFGGNVITMNGDEFTVGETGLYTLEIQDKKLERVGVSTWDMYPIPSPDWRYIAFTNDQDFPLHHEIYVLDTSTFEVKRLTDNKFDDDSPIWLPDSQHIVYHSTLGRGGLYVVSVVTGLERRLTYSGKNPFWLPTSLASLVGQPVPSATASTTPVPVQTASSQAVVTVATGIPKWSKLPAAAGLPVRGMQAVYDSDRKVIVLFGGTNNAEQTLSDTWEFDGKTWKRVDTPISPPARYWHGMAYDSQRKVVVLFGGENHTGGGLLDDTWEYGWKELDPGQHSAQTCTTRFCTADGFRQLSR